MLYIYHTSNIIKLVTQFNLIFFWPTLFSLNFWYEHCWLKTFSIEIKLKWNIHLQQTSARIIILNVLFGIIMLPKIHIIFFKFIYIENIQRQQNFITKKNFIELKIIFSNNKSNKLCILCYKTVIAFSQFECFDSILLLLKISYS